VVGFEAQLLLIFLNGQRSERSTMDAAVMTDRGVPVMIGPSYPITATKKSF